MTSYQIRESLTNILDTISIEHVLVKYIFIMSRGFDQISAELTELLYLKNRTVFSKKQQSAQEKFFELRRQSESFPLGQIFHEAIKLQTTLQSLETVFEASQDKSIREMRAQTERFYKAFEAFARGATDQTFAMLLMEASNLYTLLAAARKVFSTLQQALMPDPNASADRGRLSVLLERSDTFGAVIEKLTAIEKAYLQVCDVAEISAADHPLKIVKIEACKLWICVEGEKRVITIVGALIERFAQFIYGRYAGTETKAPISERVISTQSLVNLTDELERAGFRRVVGDTGRLQNAALELRRDLVALLAEEPKITVNENTYAVEESGWAAFLAESRNLMPPATPLHQLRETG